MLFFSPFPSLCFFGLSLLCCVFFFLTQDSCRCATVPSSRVHGDPFAARNFGWSESSGSEMSSGPFIEESDSVSLVSEDDEAPFARHGPVLESDHENVDMQCEFWSYCAFGFILDYRKFSIAYLQQLINSAWRIRGVATVVGRDSFFYLIHFDQIADLEDICAEGPWAVDGALLI